MKIVKNLTLWASAACLAIATNLCAKDYQYSVSTSVQGGGSFYFFNRLNSWVIDGAGPDMSNASAGLPNIASGDNIFIETPSAVNGGDIRIACDKSFDGANLNITLTGDDSVNLRGWNNNWALDNFNPTFESGATGSLLFGSYNNNVFNLTFKNDVTFTNNTSTTRSVYFGTNINLIDTNKGLTSLTFEKNLNVSGLKLYFASRSGEDMQIKGTLNVLEHDKASSQIILNSGVNTTDSSITTQRVKFGGLNAPYSSKISLGIMDANNAILEITGEGGSFGGELNDNLDQLNDGSALSIVMNGSGEQSFSYDSSAMGTTTVNSGSLYINGVKGMGDIVLNGGKFGAIGNGVNAKTLSVNSNAKISFDLSQYKCSITLSEGLTLPSGASILDCIEFKLIGGQYEYLLIKDNSGNSDFSSLNGHQQIFTDSVNISSTATFIADKNSLSVKFVDANPLERPEQPTSTNFEIVPQFENTVVEAGKPFSFKIKNPPEGATYKLTTNMGRSTVASGKLTEDLTFQIDTPGQAELTCEGVFESDSDEYASLLHRFAFMVSPDKLMPTSERPDDFDAYWAARKAEVNEVAPVMRLKPYATTDTYVAYTFEVDCDGADLYPNGDYVNDNDICFKGVIASGYLAVPVNSQGKKLPAVVTFYGAGSFGADSRDATDYAARGYIGMSVNPHAISQADLNSSDSSVNGPAKAKQTALNSTKYYRDRNIDSGDPKLVYFNGMFKRVYQSLRAAMAMSNSSGIETLPMWDGKNLAARGFSQGGAQTLAAAYLCPQVNVITPWCPAMCNLTSMTENIYAGWPGWISNSSQTTRIKTTIYFDTALMSATNQAAGLIGMGLIDTTCAPAVVSTAVNSMKGTNVTPFYMQRTAHGVTTAFNTAALELITGVFAANASSSKVAYSQWAASKNLWGEEALPEYKSPSTGLTNLERYFFGSDSCYQPISPTSSEGEASVGFDYQKEETVEGVTAIAMWSTNLKDWSQEGLETVESSAENGKINCEVRFSGEAPQPVFYKLELQNN